MDGICLPGWACVLSMMSFISLQTSFSQSASLKNIVSIISHRPGTRCLLLLVFSLVNFVLLVLLLLVVFVFFCCFCLFVCLSKLRARRYKTFFMLNSTEHGIPTAHKN